MRIAGRVRTGYFCAVIKRYPVKTANKMIAAAAFACTVFQAQAQQSAFSVGGTVVDSVSRRPVPGVYVTASGRGAQTDREGRFRITGLPAGRHTLLTMYYTDYLATAKEVSLPGDTAAVVLLLRPGALPVEEVVVTGTRTERRLADSPVLTSVVRERDMRKAGSTSVLETLEDNIPGIVFSQNGMGNNMRIRGLNSRYVLFLVDGERMVSEGAGGNVNLDRIDVGNIERIEVTNGAASALYGSSAVGAVINIITKKPVHGFEGSANVTYGSDNTWKARADAGSDLGVFSVRAGVFRNGSDGFGADGVGPYAARYEDYGADLRLGANPMKRLSITAAVRYFQHETFNPPASMNVSHAFTRSAAGALNAALDSRDGRNCLTLSAAYDKYLDYDVMEKTGGRKVRDNDADHLSLRITDAFRPAPVWELVGGAEYNRESLFASASLGPDPTHKAVGEGAVFAQAQWKVLKGLELVGGARYTHNSRFGGSFTPKLSAMYGIGGLRLRAGVGTAFRAPGIKELYYDFDHQGMFWVYGNSALKAEKGLYVSGSAEYVRGAFNLSVTGYCNNIDDKITLYEVINDGRREKHYRNVGSATLRGADVSLSFAVLRRIVLKGSYSFCDAVDNSTGLQLESNVRRSATVSATWNGTIARSPFSLQVAARLSSPILYQSVETRSDGSRTVTKTESKSYKILKAVLVKPFRLGKHTLEFTFKADNLLGFKDESYINSGRTYTVGFRYKFK